MQKPIKIYGYANEKWRKQRCIRTCSMNCALKPLCYCNINQIYLAQFPTQHRNKMKTARICLTFLCAIRGTGQRPFIQVFISKTRILNSSANIFRCCSVKTLYIYTSFFSYSRCTISCLPLLIGKFFDEFWWNSFWNRCIPGEKKFSGNWFKCFWSINETLWIDHKFAKRIFTFLKNFNDYVIMKILLHAKIHSTFDVIYL